MLVLSGRLLGSLVVFLFVWLAVIVRVPVSPVALLYESPGVNQVDGLPPVPNQLVATFLVERLSVYFDENSMVLRMSMCKVGWESVFFRNIVY